MIMITSNKNDRKNDFTINCMIHSSILSALSSSLFIPLILHFLSHTLSLTCMNTDLYCHAPLLPVYCKHLLLRRPLCRAKTTIWSMTINSLLLWIDSDWWIDWLIDLVITRRIDWFIDYLLDLYILHFTSEFYLF